MKMKSLRLLPLLLLLLVVEVAMAERVDMGKARQAATTFLDNNGARTTGLTDVTTNSGFRNVFVFTTENSFVLLAADDRVQPILGYSLTSRFDIENMPGNKRAWIQGYSDAIQYAIEHQTRASAEVAQQWRDLTEGDSNTGRATTVVTPLIQTQWDQDWPYNNLCPDGTVTGCAATAMAQVLKYWNYPPTGIGMHSYEWNGQTVSADFGSTTYDWDNMLNTYDSNSTEAQQMAVATLMFHCGVSLNMDYGWASTGGSGAYSSPTPGAFINYFNYSTETQLRSRSGYSDEDWMNMVKTELDQNRPLWYCGSGSGGHAFVCDGYNSDNYFHFNWGWSGNYDEYYTLDNLAPGPGGIGSGSVGNFSNNQQALFGAQPGPESSADAPVLTASLVSGSDDRDAQLNWTVANNAVYYKVYRNGSLIHTTASGNETSFFDAHIPYGTSTYYVRSIDENDIPSWPSNYAPVTIIFPAPTNLTAEQVDGGIQLSWMPCEGAVAYNVYCNDGVLESGINQTSFFDTRLIAGELNYFVRGVDIFGDESETSEMASLTIPFSTPVVDDLEASVSGNTVQLSWSAPNWCFPEIPSAMLNYGTDNCNGSFGYTFGSTYWGHRYPAENLTSYSNMSIYKASFYVRVAGEYQLLVYEGTIDGHPQTLVRQQTVWIGSVGWHDIVLPEKVQIDASLDYWVFFHDVNGISYPAAFCNYSGDEGNYYSRNPSSGVNVNNGKVFLIHTYLTDGVYTYNLYRNGSCIASNMNNTSYSDNNLENGTYNYFVKTNYYGGETTASNQVIAQIGTGTNYTITAVANPTIGGSVAGGGAYQQGQLCTMTATANRDYRFVNWTENDETVSTEVSYSFVVSSDRDLVANFELDFIVFVDENVKNLCVTNWDINGDGELSYYEASVVTSLGETFAYSDITSFDELQYFTGLTSINADAFFGCQELTTITLPNSVISIDEFSFFACSELTHITIPISVISIGDYAFYYCVSLDSMVVLAVTPPSVDESAFGFVSTDIPVYVPCSTLEAYQAANGWSAFTNIQEDCSQAQIVALSAGANWVSFKVEITLDDLKAALVEAVPGTEITIQGQKNNVKYNPNNNRWTGRLTALDLSNMYKIAVATDCEITLEGMPVNPTEHPATISYGANWIAFPLNESMTPANAFAGFAQSGDKVQSQTNNASYNGTRWSGRLTTLEPGKGYIYQSGQSETRTFTFPESGK